VLVVAVLLTALYGCGQTSSPAEKREQKAGVEQTQQPETTIGPPRDKADAAEVYVTGASGGDYWISWYDDTGDVKEVRRRPGTIVRDPEPYRIDISKAPTDGDDVLFVVAGKRTAWEGGLALVLKVGAKFRDCFSNDATDPANSEVQVLFEIGSPEANSVCRSQLSVHYAGPQPPRMLAKGPSPLTNSTAGGAGPQRRSSRP
jgi:hypothetical protein